MKIKNWDKFQHYTKRNPPWIKLHKSILDDPVFHASNALACKYLPLIWLVASENKGELPRLQVLAFRLRLSEEQTAKVIMDLNGLLSDDASALLASCKQGAMPEPEKESEAEAEKSRRAREIIDHLNLVAGSDYKASTASTVKLIYARLEDGRTVDDFKRVHTSKWEEWKGGDMQKYFRPSTLYNGTKFEAYLQSARSAPKPTEVRYLNASALEGDK